MKYLLDTNICIYLLKRSVPSVVTKMMQHRPQDVGMSAITLAELELGVSKSEKRAESTKRLGILTESIATLPFDAAAAGSYGTLRAELERKGTPIGPLGTLIAAHALALELTLVTDNVAEFKRVRGLHLENWV